MRSENIIQDKLENDQRITIEEFENFKIEFKDARDQVMRDVLADTNRLNNIREEKTSLQSSYTFWLMVYVFMTTDIIRYNINLFDDMSTGAMITIGALSLFLFQGLFHGIRSIIAKIKSFW